MSTLTNIVTLSDLTQRLTDEGYREGAPERVSAEAVAIDREVCAEASCDECGRHGLAYLALHAGRSYVAVAYCKGCGAASEF
jgi:hypothetical protein